MLEGQKVTKRFGGLSAVSDFDFSIEQGQITGLIGPNGSGKSTLFNLIAGFYAADSGRILFNGEDISRFKTYQIAKLGIARTFQIVRPFQELNVLENVAVAALYGTENMPTITRGKERALEILKFVGLEAKKNTPIHDLVAVEMKRLELARALAVKPKLLLLDEAFSGLSDTEVKEAIELIYRIRDDLGITVFLIEHVMKAVMGTCEKIMVMHYGVKLTEGKPEEVANHPQVIKAYLGKTHA
ncbi:MAG: ABC transporter ATP-binding protein [Candidatus Thorarchaeota archaeon]